MLGAECSITQSTEQLYLSSDTVHTFVMATKKILRKLTMQYSDHWEERMKLIEPQIREHVQDGYCDEDMPLRMSDKIQYFVHRQKWEQIIETWRPAPSNDFTSTED